MGNENRANLKTDTHTHPLTFCCSTILSRLSTVQQQEFMVYSPKLIAQFYYVNTFNVKCIM